MRERERERETERDRERKRERERERDRERNTEKRKKNQRGNFHYKNTHSFDILYQAAFCQAYIEWKAPPLPLVRHQ